MKKLTLLVLCFLLSLCTIGFIGCGESPCTEHVDGNTDYVCDTCGKELEKPHVHDYGTTYKTSQTNHWKECSCGEKSEDNAHSDGNLDGLCDVCSFEVGLPQIEGITFSGATFGYDGNEKKIELQGTLPQNSVVTYSCAEDNTIENKATNAGEYNITVTIACEGYQTKTLTAKLIITKATYDMSNIAWNYSSAFTFNGSAKTVTINENALPNGVTVKAYTNNDKTNAGSYTASVSFNYDSANYNTPVVENLNWNILKATYDMSNIAWNYSSAFTFNGSAKTVTINENALPNGVTVKAYANNDKTNAGSYTASVSFNYDSANYNAPVVENLNWSILKATISVTLENNQKVTKDEELHLPELTGTIPTGVTVNYYIDEELNNEGVSETGTYTVRIVLSGDNYETLTLTGTFKISLNLLGFAQKVIEAFGPTPDPWSFLPDSFDVTNKEVLSSNIPDYSSFVNVSSIPTNGIGKQLSVVYGALNKTTKAISYVQPVYNVLGTIKNLYTTFIDDHPEEYKNYSDTVAGITFAIAITETEYLLSATVGTVDVKIFANVDDHSYGARVQLTETTVLKYTVGENSLTIAFNILNTAATMIEFVRENDMVVGYMYEYLGALGFEVKTSALIHVDDTYTTLIGTKGDFIPTAVSRNCEVYRNTTGKLVGTEVREELDVKFLGLATYNTLWYNLWDFSGVNSIKKIDEQNGLNADKVYINGAEDSIHTKTVSTLPTSKKAYSRRFDIEFKTMYFYTYNQDKEEYEEISIEIPMLFVQEEQAGTLEEDFEDKNGDYLTGSVSLNVSNADKQAVNYGYYTLLVTYDAISENINLDDIKSYCGE